MKIGRIVVLLAVVGCLLVSSALAQGQKSQQSRDEQINGYFEMMRKDLRTERQSMVDQAMRLEAADKAKFWTIYDKYQGEYKALKDQRLVNIKKYADNFGMMTDAVADEIAMKSMDIDSQRAAMRKKYYQQMKGALGARVAGRFLFIEVVLDEMLGLQLASQIPVME